MALPPLPAEVLSLICTEALQCGTSPATLLTLNSRWHEVTSSILYSCLTIPACSVLLSATSATGQEDCCSTANVWVNRLRGKLHAITQNHVYAGKVKAFYILPKDWLSLGHLPTCVKHVEENHLQTRTTGTELDDASTHTSDAVTESEILELIMNHLTGIHSLSWLLLRPPSATFMATLQNACIRMLYLDIITCPGDLLQNSAIHATDCSPLFIKTSTIGSSPALRWDLASLQTLDARYLVHLTLQNLSLEGIRTLGQLSSALVSCEELSICNTLFVDDILLSAVSGAMPKLGALRIKHMAGTKLTSKGIASVMESSEALQEFEMLDVQGRLSKACWEDIAAYPPGLRKVTISYSENNPHSHSWTTDHLSSIVYLIERTRTLETLVVARITPEVIVHGQQGLAESADLPIALRPRPLPDGFIAIIMDHGKNLRNLNLNFWELTYDRLRTLVQTNPNLEVFQVLLDAPFNKLLGTSSTSMSTSRIRTLTVSVTDRYLLETPSVTAVKSRMRSTSLAGMEVQVKPTRGRQTSVGHTAGGSGSGSSLGQSGASALKDVKKFMKRFPRLANLALVGKGETGRWKAVRCAAKDIAVTFLPVFTGHDGGERSDRLLQLQAPFFGPVLRSLGLDIMRRIQHHSPVSLQEASLASSATSSSIATILSTSSSETALSSLTTVVTSGGVSPKAEMPPLAKVGKAHVADSPAKSVNKAPGTSGGLTTQVKSSAMKQQNFSSIVQKEPSPSPGNTSPVRVLQSPPSEKRIHRDGWAAKKSASTKQKASPDGRKKFSSSSKSVQKTVPLTEENLKQLKKTTQAAKSKTSIVAVPQQQSSVIASGRNEPEVRKLDETLPEGFALVSRSRKTGKKT